MANFINDMCLALEQTASPNNEMRMQAENYIKEVSVEQFWAKSK